MKQPHRFQNETARESPGQQAVWLLNTRGRVLRQNTQADAWRENRRPGDETFPHQVEALIVEIRDRQRHSETPVAESIDLTIGRQKLRFTVSSFSLRDERAGDDPLVIVLMDRLAAHPPLDERFSAMSLTKREREIALLVIEGHAYRSISEKLGIAEQTVRDHMRSIFAKADVHNRASLMALILDF